MLQLVRNTHIDFIGKRKVSLVISVSIIVLGLAFLAQPQLFLFFTRFVPEGIRVRVQTLIDAGRLPGDFGLGRVDRYRHRRCLRQLLDDRNDATEFFFQRNGRCIGARRFPSDVEQVGSLFG